MVWILVPTHYKCAGTGLINQQLIGSNTATISTSVLNAGVYFANIKDDAGITKTIKFVK
jgi:hypothetical protein